VKYIETCVCTHILEYRVLCTHGYMYVSH